MPRLTQQERAQRATDRTGYERRQDERRRQGKPVQTPAEDAIARMEAPTTTAPSIGRQLEPAPVPDDAIARVESLISKWGAHAAVNALLAVLSRPAPATDALDVADAGRVLQIRRKLS